MKKFRVLLLTAVLAVAMMAGSLSVFAADEVIPVSKTLNVANGVTTEQTFAFKLTQANKTSAPTGHVVAPKTVSDITTTVTVSTDGTGATTVTGGFSQSDFADLDVAGEYLFTLTETTEDAMTDGYGLDANTGDNTYYVQVLVKNGESGLEYEYHMASNNFNAEDAADEPGAKVTEAAFTNLFTEVAPLTVSKVVSNPEYADPDQEFTIKVVFTRDTTNFNPATATIGYDGETYDYGDEITLILKDGGSAELTNIPVGTTYVVSEEPPTNYETPEITYSSGDTGLIEDTATNENANTATVTNTLNDITITGVIMNILPFVMMIAIGGAAAALYVVSRRRKMAR
jgi:hypothetical protein